MSDKRRSAINKQARRRGIEFENEVANAFKEAGFPDARRNIQSQGGRKVGPDVVGVPVAVGCKRTRHTKINKFLRDAIDETAGEEYETGGSKPTVVVTRGDGFRACCVITLEDFLQILATVTHPSE